MKAVLILLCFATMTHGQTIAPATQPAVPPLKIASATLLARSSHENEPGTRFSFQNDLRAASDADGHVGDLYLDGKPAMLRCQKHTADRSTIVDLGQKTWAQINSLPQQARAAAEMLPAIAGHVYLIHVDDTELDFWAMVRVVNLVERDHCDIEWVRLDQSKPATVTIPPAAQAQLASLLSRQDDNVDKSFVLQTPRIVLQIRAGAGGGNPNRIDMAGRTTAYVRSASATPLKFDTAPQMNDPSIAYFDGGQVPRGKCLVIRTITYQGSAKGDTNGHGSLILHAGKLQIVNLENVARIEQAKWEGRIEIRHGQDSQVYLEVADSSSADVLIEGQLIDDVPAAK